MIDRIPSGFHPFVIPFLVGMGFVFLYLIIGFIRLLFELNHKERQRFFLSLISDSFARCIYLLNLDLVCEIRLLIHHFRVYPILHVQLVRIRLNFHFLWV